MIEDCRVFLIGGTSHCGKSTLAQSLAAQLGWECLSTDRLAGAPRHPGRPWQVPPLTVPQHVAEHYQTLPVDELIRDVLRHYRENIWPLIEALLATRALDLSTERLVLEGSAILPERIVALPYRNIAAVWLSASRECLAQRIYRESQYATKSPAEKALIDKFLQRTWQYNDLMLAEVKRLGLASLVVDDTSDPEELIAACRLWINQ
jgi:2-phosphoglycerate kinase